MYLFKERWVLIEYYLHLFLFSCVMDLLFLSVSPPGNHSHLSLSSHQTKLYSLTNHPFWHTIVIIPVHSLIVLSYYLLSCGLLACLFTYLFWLLVGSIENCLPITFSVFLIKVFSFLSICVFQSLCFGSFLHHQNTFNRHMH